MLEVVRHAVKAQSPNWLIAWTTAAWFAACGSILILLWFEFRSHSAYRCPAFCLYLIAFVVHLAVWDPYDMAAIAAWEYVLLPLKILAALEAFWLACSTLSPTDRRYMLALALVVGGVMFLVATRGYDPSYVHFWIRTEQLASNVGLAAAGLLCVMCFTFFPVERVRTSERWHGALLIALFTVRAVKHLYEAGYHPRMNGWLVTTAMFFCAAAICFGLWATHGMLASKPQLGRKDLLHRENPTS